MSDWNLCIDFGTAYSKAAAAPAGAWSRFDPGQVRPLMVNAAAGGFLLDSAVFVDVDAILFARAAVDRADALAGQDRMALRSFKTLLSVTDLERALNTSAPRAIDPQRKFQMRELIVLYLAYLLASIEQAKAADPVLAGQAVALRYAAPAWRGAQAAGSHAIVSRLFGAADALRRAVGDRLLAPEGLPRALASEALPKALAEAQTLPMGLIFESTAAAAYTSIGLDSAASHLIVVDVGAGTTDITALHRRGGRMVELEAAQETFNQAGDFIDRVMANTVIGLDKRARSVDQQTALWTALMRDVRDVKENLFAEGQVKFRHEGKVLTLSMRDIERDEDFRAFLKTLTKAYDNGLSVIGAAAGRGAEVMAVAVGGGAYAPFVQDLLRRKASGGAAPRISPRPAVPEWAHTSEFKGNLAPVFPQLAIAIGGALAPDDMLAAPALKAA